MGVIAVGDADINSPKKLQQVIFLRTQQTSNSTESLFRNTALSQVIATSLDR